MNVAGNRNRLPALENRMGPKGAKSGAGRTGGLGLASAHGVHGMAGQQEPVVEPREL